jgi:hypothetical protein
VGGRRGFWETKRPLAEETLAAGLSDREICDVQQPRGAVLPNRGLIPRLNHLGISALTFSR